MEKKPFYEINGKMLESLITRDSLSQNGGFYLFLIYI